jgi:anti-sigma regulatory factor (Ser/Thr protein kinase)
VAADINGDIFRHEALFYGDEPEFVSATSAFIEDGLATGEPVLAVVDAHKIRLLRSALGDRADQVEFADMAVVGHNPGRILDAWYRFAADHVTGSNGGARGIGEPVYPTRTAAELVECHLHETLLNLAFPPQPAWTLLCPYDTSALAPAVVAEARRNHPFLRRGTDRQVSGDYEAEGALPEPWQLRDPLPEPPRGIVLRELEINHADLTAVRRLAQAHAVEAGASTARAGDLALAVSELATNTLRHGGGRGVLRMWLDRATMVCEVGDRGHITDPLVGRRRPGSKQLEGRGLWLVNQLCDLTQIRTSPDGTVVRIHMRLA